MKKSRLITVKVEPELYNQIKNQSKETGVPYSQVVRRALEVWIVTGVLPKLPSQKGDKRKTK